MNVIKDNSEYEEIVKKSKFISFLYFVKSIDEVNNYLNELKATGIVLAGIAVMLVAGVPLTAIVQAGATTLTGAAAGVVGYYAGKKSGVLK